MIDIYVLDSTFRNSSLVERYKSFIWTERFTSAGDFELVQTYLDSKTSPVKIGNYIAISDSHRLAKVDSMYLTMSDDNELLVKYTGESMEKIYDTRSVMPMVTPKYYWNAEAHDSPSLEKINGTTVRTNYFPNPRFFLEGLETAGGFIPKRTSTNSAYTTIVSSSRGLRIAGKTSTNDTYAQLNGVNLSPGNWIGIRAELTLDESLKGSLNPRSRRIVFFHRPSSGGSYSEILSPAAPNTSDETHVVELIFQVPANASDNFIRLYNGASGDNGIANWDRVMVLRYSTEAALREAMAKGYFDGDTAYLNEHPEIIFTGPEKGIIDKIIEETSLNNIDAPRENLPFTKGFPTDTTLSGYTNGQLDVSEDEVSVAAGPATVYSTLNSTADALNQGFFVMRNPTTGQLFTGSFSGTDRTLGQQEYNPILFSSELGNVTGLSEIRSNRLDRMFAAVYGRYDMIITDRSGNVLSHENILGLSRSILPVDAKDIDWPKDTAILEASLIARGVEELTAAVPINTLDGEITQPSNLVYEKDFAVGTMVSMRSESGATSSMRIVEYIFVSDDEGQRSYPTLTSTSFVEADSWEGQVSTLVWNDALGVWEEQ